MSTSSWPVGEEGASAPCQLCRGWTKAESDSSGADKAHLPWPPFTRHRQGLELSNHPVISAQPMKRARPSSVKMRTLRLTATHSPPSKQTQDTSVRYSGVRTYPPRSHALYHTSGSSPPSQMHWAPTLSWAMAIQTDISLIHSKWASKK